MGAEGELNPYTKSILTFDDKYIFKVVFKSCVGLRERLYDGLVSISENSEDTRVISGG